MSEMDKYYEALGLKPGASEEEIRQAYKDLVKVWHPDRFSNDTPRFQEKANEKLKEIVIAYDKLKSYLTSNAEQHTSDTGGSQPPPDEPPPRPEREQHKTSEDKGHGGFQSPPKTPFTQTPASPAYAGFWNRFGAIFVDSVIVGIAGSILVLPFRMATGSRGATFVVSMSIGWLYYTLFESSSHRATPGKMAVGLTVADLNREQLSFGRANGRFWGKFVSLAILGLGYIMAGFTEKKQALHDIMANTLVLKRPEGARAWVTLAAIILSGALMLLLSISDIRKSLTPTNRAPYTTSAPVPSAIQKEELKPETQLHGQWVDAPPGYTPFGIEAPKTLAPRKGKWVDLDEAPNPPAQQKGKWVDLDEAPKPQSGSGKWVDNSEDWFQKGDSFYKTQNYREAIDAYSKAIALNDREAKFYHSRGFVFYQLGDFQQAIRDFDKAIEINPRSTATYGGRGFAYGAIGNHQQAIRDYDKVIGFDPRSAVAYFGRGVAYGAIGDHQQAIRDYDKAIELEPRNATPYFGRGFAYESIGNHQQALDDYRIAARLEYKPAKDLLISRGITW